MSECRTKKVMTLCHLTSTSVKAYACLYVCLSFFCYLRLSLLNISYLSTLCLLRHFSLGLYGQVTAVTSQPGQGVVRHLEVGLKDADLVSLKRLLVVQIRSAADWSQDNPPPETMQNEMGGKKQKSGTSRHKIKLCISTHTV